MILKIVDANGTVLGAVNVYENNYNGEVSVNDTFHCNADAVDLDTILEQTTKKWQSNLTTISKENLQPMR